MRGSISDESTRQSFSFAADIVLLERDQPAEQLE